MRANGKTIVAIFLAGIIGTTVISGAVLAILDHYTLSASGNHLHFDLPIVALTGNSFLELGTPMIAAGIAGVLFILGIMVLQPRLTRNPS